MPVAPGHTRLGRLAWRPAPKAESDGGADGGLSVDRLRAVYESGTVHEEDHPVQLRIRDPELCVTGCVEEYGNPCTRFCPAEVYVLEEDDATGIRRLRIDASNCLHCKRCDIMDPYQNIEWTPPEAGGGPRYVGM